MPFIDLHCHFLWDTDDGPTEMAVTAAMLDIFSAGGYCSVAATPHVRRASFEEVKRKVIEKTLMLAAEASSRNPPVDLIAGGEHFLDDGFLAMFSAGDFIPLGSAGKYVLIELPVQSMPINLEDILFRIRVKKYIPLLAHVERYSYMKHEMIERLMEQECAVQVNLGSLAGIYGREEEKRAMAILKRGLCHVLGTDAHSPEEAEKAIRLGMARLEREGGRDAVEVALSTNPRRIVTGESQERLERVFGG